ncbi:hypothetical protein DY000_02015301 [Brassica cretica]|uniref:REJ domain-containing protein n=1 Tax=Brassica cretica TaxID=69181 RepID=A0ABQ7CTI5_BRACR|nr:hypothetical protein DY000_02015301 [Brassica cretica]
MSLSRQVLQPLLQHDPEHFQELLSLYKISLFINLLLKFIPLSISPRYSLALQVYTTPAQHLDSTWSSPLNPTSASATTSATTSGQTSYIFNLPLLASCADQAQYSSGSATTYSLALQVYTTPAQHLDSAWSSPLNPTSASATTPATTSGQTSYILTFICVTHTTIEKSSCELDTLEFISVDQ